jgi:hypothetical protein
MGISDVIIARGYCDHSSHKYDDATIARGYCEYIVSMIAVDFG